MFIDKYKNQFVLIIFLLPSLVYAYPKEILEEFEQVQNRFQTKMMTSLSVREVAPKQIDPLICQILKEYQNDTYEILEKNQQYLDEEERKQVKSKTLLKDSMEPFELILKEKGIDCVS